ncbi:MAG: carboxypeptidase regulatory-like domain-containing protein, partial [Calditrichaeota bacterium]|nr:carboxypeptidase regulatory-like domain-containing protein [Calditrichota bacterium]
MSAHTVSADVNIDESYGHQEVITVGAQAEAKTVTDQPGVDVQINIPDILAQRADRDDGEGSLEWTVTDENGISDNVAIAGGYVAIGYTLNDHRLELRNVDDGELIFVFEVTSGSGNVDMSAEGDLIAYSAIDSVWLFRPDGEGEPFFRFGMDGYYPGPVKVSSDGEYVVACGIDPDDETNTVWCFRDAELDPEWIFEVPAGEAFSWYGVNIAGDGDIVIVNGKYRFYVLNLADGELLYEAPTYNTESEVAVSDDGSVLVVSSLTGVLLVYLLDDDGYSELWRYRFRGARSSWVSACAISADGSTIAAGTLDFFDEHYGGRLAVFETFGNGEPLWIGESLSDEVSDIALSYDGSIIAAASWGDFEHQMPDLFVHERFSPDPFYTLSDTGSVNCVVLDDNAERVAVGGKGAHSREFGRGGIVSMVSLTLVGGTVSGSIRDRANDPVENAIVFVENNPYQAVTNEEGNYNLRIEVDDERSVDVIARKPGYMNRIDEDVTVINNRNTANVNFVLDEADEPPAGIRATQGQRNMISISWDRYNEDGRLSDLRTSPTAKSEMRLSAEFSPIRSAIGDEPLFTGLTPWASEISPRRDDHDDAESINIYRSFLSGGHYSLVGSVDGDANLFVDDDNVLPLHLYYYVLTADFGSGESAYSEEVTGWLADDFLIWEVDLDASLETVEFDGD